MSGATSRSKSESLANAIREAAKMQMDIVIVRSKSMVSVDICIMNWTLLGERHSVLLSIVLVLNEMVLVLVLEGVIRIEYSYSYSME